MGSDGCVSELKEHRSVRTLTHFPSSLHLSQEVPSSCFLATSITHIFCRKLREKLSFYSQIYTDEVIYKYTEMWNKDGYEIYSYKYAICMNIKAVTVSVSASHSHASLCSNETLKWAWSAPGVSLEDLES